MKANLLVLILILMASIPANSQNKLYLTANGTTKSATLVDNEATHKLISLLEKGPISLSLSDNGGFEKIGTLPQSLPTSDVRQTAQSGDIMLYVSNVLCFFYGSNTWTYTKIGTFDGMSSAEIKEFLSGNQVSLSLSPGNTAATNDVNVSDSREGKVYDLNGKLITARPLQPGIYITNGKKILVK